MKRYPFIAGALSLILPGLGQIYVGEGNKGAAVIVAAIIIANLNVIILPLIAIANPVLPLPPDDIAGIWKYWIPRVTHDIASFWSIIFWIWAVVDAFKEAKKAK